MKRDANDITREEGPDALRKAFDRSTAKQSKRGLNGANRFRLIPFRELRPGTASNYLIKGVIPKTGIVLIWGPPKCGKSFWTFDMMMHVPLGWQYRGHRV